MPITFRFRWVPFIAALLVMAIGIALGQWQLRRAAEKQAIEARLEARGRAPALTVGAAALQPAEAEYRKVAAQGEFLRGWPIYLDNRPHKGVAGFYLAMPLKIAGSDMHILVLRGWFPRDPVERTHVPAIPVPSGAVEVHGIARLDPGRVLQLGQEAPLAPGAIVQNLDIAQLARASGLKFQPVMLEQTSDTRDGLVRDWPRPSSGVDKHYGYAFQWFALAATAVLFFVATGIRRGKGNQAPARR